MNKFISLLGIGMKAGYITAGETGVDIDIKKKKSSLVIIAKNASKNTKNKFINLCNSNNIKYLIISDKESLGQILGKGYVAVVSVKDKQFSSALLKKAVLD